MARCDLSRITTTLIFMFYTAPVHPHVAAATDTPKVYPVYALYYSHSKYSITPKRSTWKHAQELCRQRNSRLAHFNSEAEFNEVMELIKSSGVHSSKTFWTGIHYLRQKAFWGVYTGHAAGFLKWSPDEPRLFEGEERRECVMLWNPLEDRRGANEWNFSLSTENCQLEMFSICQTVCDHH